jgi:hypothetical protein
MKCALRFELSISPIGSRYDLISLRYILEVHCHSCFIEQLDNEGKELLEEDQVV